MQAPGGQLAEIAGGGQNQQISGEDLAAIAQTIGREMSLRERLAIESSVAEHGNFSLFAGVAVEETRRRDRYMFPLNTDYDLFSLGPDKVTATSLGEKSGLDDVIRANNGGYFGPAEGY